MALPFTPNERQINRLIYSSRDFHLALSSLTFLAESHEYGELYTRVERRRFAAYETSAIISFCRPLVPSKDGTTLNLGLIRFKFKDADTILRDRLFNIRNKIIAHSDESEMHFNIQTFDLSEDYPETSLQVPFPSFEDVLQLNEEEFGSFDSLVRRLLHCASKTMWDLAQECPSMMNKYIRPASYPDSESAG